MGYTRRRVLLSVPSVVGTAGCSALMSSESASLKVLIFNATNAIQPLTYTITRGDSKFVSTETRVPPTVNDDHHTLRLDRASLRDGDELEMVVTTPGGAERRHSSLTVSCSNDCVNWFTIRIGEGRNLEVYSSTNP